MKNKVLGLLMNNGKVSTSRIAGTLGIDYNYALRLLEELLLEGKIEKIEETLATYWKVKNEDKAT